MSMAKPAALATPANGSGAVDADQDIVIVPSRLLGEMPVRRADLLTLPAGLFGFEDARTFALVGTGRDGLWWLQSAERAELAFLVADPFTFFPGHEIDVPATDLALLDVTEETPLTALLIVTLPATDGAPTANLRAPLIVDPARRLARQIVLADERLSLTADISL